MVGIAVAKKQLLLSMCEVIHPARVVGEQTDHRPVLFPQPPSLPVLEVSSPACWKTKAINTQHPAPQALSSSEDTEGWWIAD